MNTKYLLGNGGYEINWTVLLIIESIFVKVLQYLLKQWLLWCDHSSDAGDSSEFYNILNKPISLLVALMAIWSHFLFFKLCCQAIITHYCNWVQYLDLKPDWINPQATIFVWVCNHWVSWLFLSWPVFSFKAFLFICYWEAISTWKFISFCDIKQSYLPWNDFWYNYFKVRNIVKLMRNAFGAIILNVFSCDYCICYKYNYRDIFPYQNRAVITIEY